MDQNLTLNISYLLFPADVLNQKGGFKHIGPFRGPLFNVIRRHERTLKVGDLMENKRAIIWSTFLFQKKSNLLIFLQESLELPPLHFQECGVIPIILLLASFSGQERRVTFSPQSFTVLVVYSKDAPWNMIQLAKSIMRATEKPQLPVSTPGNPRKHTEGSTLGLGSVEICKWGNPL